MTATLPDTGTVLSYEEFLAAKASLAPSSGLDCEPDEIHPVLKPHQRDSIAWAVRGGRRALFQSFGLGKAQPLDEPVLTPRGWRPIGEIAVGDEVISADGHSTRVVGVYPQGRRPMFSVTFSDGSQARCDEDHLWTVAKDADVHNERPWRVLSTRQILEAGLKEPCGKSPDRWQWRIPVVQPVDHPAADLAIDPYVLGVLLGDGSFRREGGPEFTTVDEEIAAEVKSRLPAGMRMQEFALGNRALNYRLVVEGMTNRHKVNPFLAAARRWGLQGCLSRDKFVPPEYLTSSISQRLDLLCGLMDTDGFAAQDGTIQFSSSSSRLAGDVVALVQSLGGTARKASKIPTYVYKGERRHGLVHYTLTLRLPNGTVPFLLQRKTTRCRDRYYAPTRKITGIDPAGEAEAVCIAVENPSRLYVTRDYVVTHNTIQQLEIERLILSKLGSGRGLIVCPLGVRQEFARDAAMIGVETAFIRSVDEAKRDGIYVTNYESIRDGKLDPRGFDVVSLDEASVLRGFGSVKTFRELMRLYEGSAAFRFVATATPSPNEFIELLSYAAFLDVLDVGAGKTLFFKRNSEKADSLTLLPHREDAFWQWVSSWALFLQSPADLGYPADGYELPPLDIRWHEVQSPAAPYFGEGRHKDGQGYMFRDASFGVQDAAREKRMSMDARVAKTAEIVAESPGDHFLLWHDLEDERRAIEAAVPGTMAVWGSQDLDERERRIAGFSDGEFRVLATKPVIAGSGCNFQRHCHRAVFTGIGFKFNDFIQACHRIHRFLQAEPVRIDIIYSEAERGIREQLEKKWRQHDVLTERMGEIIRERGLARDALTSGVARTSGVDRQEARGENYLLVNNDSVLETAGMADDSIDLIVTSIPFGTQYEYSEAMEDFGHTENNDHFWQQMDYLTPQLLRVLAPGRIAAIHVKDRITPGGLSGLGFQTLTPFHAEAITHYMKHGFAFMAQITVVTDVVRENNQTYRLGWTENCKDGTKMGSGVPEYILVFRKPPTDNATSYADTPVVKSKRDYSRARWQTDAHGFWRSNGDRPLLPEEFDGLPASDIFRKFRDHWLENPYDYEQHVAIGEHLEDKGRLPSGFMLLQPPSWHADVWTDVARMRTLNMLQERKGQQQHLCPIQFDIVDRLIDRYSMPGETVYDPFGGLMTVPYCAVKKGRGGVGVELNPRYYADGVAYVKTAAEEAASPTLFDLITPGDDPSADLSQDAS